MFDVLNEEFVLFFAKAMPLVLNFCTTRTVSWTLIIGFIRERIKKFDRGRK